MGQEKNKSGVNLLLIFIIVILAVLCVLFATGTINLENGTKCTHESGGSESTKFYSYSDLTGLYTHSVSVTDIDYTLYNKLYLFDDGTFAYELAYPARYGYIGNYIIDGNTIKLNKLFEFNSGVGLFFGMKKYELTITDNNTLVDSNDYLNKAEIGYTGTINLKRASDSEASEFLSKYNLENMLDNQQIDNKSTTNKNG